MAFDSWPSPDYILTDPVQIPGEKTKQDVSLCGRTMWTLHHQTVATVSRTLL